MNLTEKLVVITIAGILLLIVTLGQGVESAFGAPVSEGQSGIMTITVPEHLVKLCESKGTFILLALQARDSGVAMDDFIGTIQEEFSPSSHVLKVDLERITRDVYRVDRKGNFTISIPSIENKQAYIIAMKVFYLREKNNCFQIGF